MLGGAEIHSNISQYSAGRCSSNISVYCAIVRNIGVYSRGAIYPSISQYIHSALLFVSILSMWSTWSTWSAEIGYFFELDFVVNKRRHTQHDVKHTIARTALFFDSSGGWAFITWKA